MQQQQQTFIQISTALFQSTDLDAADKILIADVYSFHRSGMTYYRSIATIASAVGLHRSSITRKLKRLHDDGYLIVKHENKSTRQTNTITVGPLTLALFNGQQTQAEAPMKKAEPVMWHTPNIEPVPFEERPVPVEQPIEEPEVRLSKASDFIPKHILSRLHYFPKQGRSMTVNDAVTVLKLYGVDHVTAKNHCEGMDLRSIPIGDQLDAVKKTGADMGEAAKRSTMKGFRAFSYNDM